MRIVSLCPSLTELCCDLGCAAELVAVTKFCEHPDAMDLEKVGGTKDPDTSRILALAPDLVLMNREENRLEDARALQDAGLRVHASMPISVQDTVECVRTLGKDLGRMEQADALADRISERARTVAEHARTRQATRFAYLIWRNPWMAAASNTYIDALLSTAGGQNVFAHEAGRYPDFNPEALSEHAPDLVLLSSEPFPFKKRHIEELGRLSGLDVARFRLVDGKLLSWHGSHTYQGLGYADELFASLHPAPAPR